MRIEPPVSVPSAPGTRPAAVAAPLPAARPAADPLEVPRIACRAEVRARRGRAERELVRVELPDDDRPGGPQTRDGGGVCHRDVVGQDPGGSRGRRVPATSITSLTAIGTPWRGPRSARRSRSAASSSASSARTAEKGVHRAVESLDAREALGHRLARRELAGADPSGKAGEAHPVSPSGANNPAGRVPGGIASSISRSAGRIAARNRVANTRSSSLGSTPWARASARSSSSDGTGLDFAVMPIYEYRCGACGERYEEYLSTSTKPAPPCPACGSAKVERLLSKINTEWLPSDVAWDRVGRSWD